MKNINRLFASVAALVSSGTAQAETPPTPAPSGIVAIERGVDFTSDATRPLGMNMPSSGGETNTEELPVARPSEGGSPGTRSHFKSLEDINRTIPNTGGAVKVGMVVSATGETVAGIRASVRRE